MTTIETLKSPLFPGLRQARFQRARRSYPGQMLSKDLFQRSPLSTGFSATPATRFGSQYVPDFKYDKYADAMVNFSVGGIQPKDLAITEFLKYPQKEQDPLF